jgi:transcriptional regulator with XRE-family HTH domain
MIGTTLRQLRKQQNFSLRALSQATGLSHSFICDIEQGRCNPSIKTLHILAKALSVKPEIFFSKAVVDYDLRPSKNEQVTIDATGEAIL